MRKFIGMKLCDFALWFLALGPKLGFPLDQEEKVMQREFIELWRKIKWGK